VFRLDERPLDPTCTCDVCTRYSLAYLHHLMKGKHTLGSRLISIHNLFHYQTLTQRMRAAILLGQFDTLYRELKDALDRPRPI
jgi:queuine tRNA-ribosyltransferase